jgi:hypothetical protein
MNIYEVKGVRKLKYHTDIRLREILMRGGLQQAFLQHYEKQKFSAKVACSKAFERVTSFTYGPEGFPFYCAYIRYVTL